MVLSAGLGNVIEEVLLQRMPHADGTCGRPWPNVRVLTLRKVIKVGGRRHAPADPPGTPDGTLKVTRNAHGKHPRHAVQHPPAAAPTPTPGVLADMSGSFPWAFRVILRVPAGVPGGSAGACRLPHTYERKS